MAFRDFSFPEVQQTLGLTLAEADLFSGVPAAELSAAFAERMRGDIALALAINTVTGLDHGFEHSLACPGVSANGNGRGLQGLSHPETTARLAVCSNQ